MEKDHKVLIMRCDTYDADRNARIVKEGMQTLGVRPSRRILLKPNVVLAHPEVFPHALAVQANISCYQMRFHRFISRFR